MTTARDQAIINQVIHAALAPPTRLPYPCPDCSREIVPNPYGDSCTACGWVDEEDQA